MSLKSLLFLAALAVSSQARPEGGINGPLTKRTGSNGCNADNALRNLRDARYSSSASLFCSEWLQSTITNTLSLTVTASATATETPEPVTVTTETTDTVTNTETTFTTEYPTAVNTFFKRGEIGYPTWLAATYPATRVSSACSCFISSPSAAITATYTTTVATVTNTATTTLEPLTGTETSITTATASATTVAVQTGPEIPCGVVGCTNGAGFIDWQSLADRAACKSLCKSTTGCLSYQWSSWHCTLFDVEVGETYATGYSTDVNCANYRFYDARCL
ncbi:hypothetical protein TWF481_011692 [Arthrobotrys musiformis]|uniref:Apple domain-containing protein n=1 Tax=Arthrobotrys musiformis TaxID=47236 RepID=A0AAV9VZ17_9PEZI